MVELDTLSEGDVVEHDEDGDIRRVLKVQTEGFGPDGDVKFVKLRPAMDLMREHGRDTSGMDTRSIPNEIHPDEAGDWSLMGE